MAFEDVSKLMKERTRKKNSESPGQTSIRNESRKRKRNSGFIFSFWKCLSDRL